MMSAKIGLLKTNIVKTEVRDYSAKQCPPGFFIIQGRIGFFLNSPPQNQQNMIVVKIT